MTLTTTKQCPVCYTECEIKWGISGECPNCETEYHFIERFHIGRRGDFSWEELEWIKEEKETLKGLE